MKTQITAFFMAWGMFLSIPCPAKIWDEKARPWQLVYLPLVGLLVGAIWALAAYLTGLFGRLPAICAAILAALPFLLTGFIHLDGFMDCCDAILSRRDLATRQKILKDSCRLVFGRVYDFPDARHVRSLPGLRREKRLLGADSDSGLLALCLELLRVRLPPDADEPVRIRL